jgi:hypothetical protein
MRLLTGNLRVQIVALCGLAVSLCGGEGNGASGRHVRLREVARMRAAMVVDETTDGRHLLFFDGDASWGYRINVRGGRVTAKQERFPSGNSLRVAESGTWATVARIGCSECYRAQFGPSGKEVFFSDFVRVEGQLVLTRTLWEPASGKVRNCPTDPKVGFGSFVFLEAQTLLGTVGRSLARMSVPDCSVSVIGPIDPAEPDRQLNSALGVVLSPDKRYAVLPTHPGGGAVVWDVENNKVVRRLDSASSYFEGEVTFTPDGRRVIFKTSTERRDRDFLLVYDTATYESRRINHASDFSGATRLAVSPDSRTLAVSYRTEEETRWRTIERAVIVLYDLETGQEVGRAVHSKTTQKRNKPFAAWIGRLLFTRDGRYLLSSTGDTVVWEVLTEESGRVIQQ